MKNSDFYTIRGYSLKEELYISHAMEDYLEMIFRYSQQEDHIRVNQLAVLLNVRPSSASKMASKLREKGMVRFEPYGVIRLTDQGKAMGEYLLKRHNILNDFFCRINKTETELELVEKIEHHFTAETIENIEALMENMNCSKDT